MMRVADYIAGKLKEIGVKDVFMLSGGGMMHLIDAVSRVDGITYHCNQHEQACAMAAEAYGRLTHNLGVCYATSGPGATNILTGLVGAWLDSAPVLYLTGQSNTHQTIRGSKIEGLRQFGTFEVDIVPIVQSVTKYAVFLEDPSTARYHVEKAIHLARTGRPGPVLIDVPLNVQGAKIDPSTQKGYDPTEDDAAIPQVDDATMKDILERLTAAKRPLILAGHGVRAAEAADLFREVIDMLGIPVVTTQLAKDLLPYDHPLFVGHPGVKGDRASGFAIQNADVVLTIGCSLHLQTTGYESELFAPNAYKIQVDLDSAVMKREKVGVQQKVHSSVESFLSAMNGQLTPMDTKHLDGWKKRCSDWKTKYAVMNEPHERAEGSINYYDFSDALSDVLKGDEILTADAGSAFYIFGQAFRAKANQRYIASGGLATMGYTVPASIGLAAAAPDKTIIALTGDGSFHMCVGETQTIRHGNFNIKLFVLNNSGYSCIRNTQDSYFSGHYVGTDATSGLTLPSLEQVAKTYDLPYVKISDQSTLKADLEKVLAMKGPVFCEVIAPFNQPFMPVLTSEKQEDGRLVAKAIHDLFPFLSKEEIAANMAN